MLLRERGKNCFGNDPLGCLEYNDCNILYKNRFPHHKHDIDNICTATTTKDNAIVVANQQSDRRQCELLCESLLLILTNENCCDPYTTSNPNNTCYHDNLGGCYSYSRCHTLFGKQYNETIIPKLVPSSGYEYPPLPSLDNSIPSVHINTTCSQDIITNNTSNRAECEKLCEPARCCWDYENQSINDNRTDSNDDNNKLSVSSCIHEKFPYCLDYAMCQNLRNNTSNTLLYSGTRNRTTGSLPVALSNLDSLCKSKANDCYSHCSSASACCNDAYGDCYRDNFLSCLSYSTCKNYFGVNLQVPTLNNLLSPPQKYPKYNDFNTVCNTTYINKYGKSECERACSVSECCWKIGNKLDGNCFGTDPLGCMQYVQCRVLFHMNHTK